MKLIHFDSIDSTSKYLIQNYQNIDDLTFVSASYQTEGKGRNNRSWKSDKGANLLISVLLKNKTYVSSFSLLSIATASVILQVLKEYGLSNVKVKWPNDVYVNDKKICGILLQGQLPNYLVVGVGLNVNQKNFEGEYRINPTSMFIEKENYFDINKVEESFANEFLKMLDNPIIYLKIAKDNNYLIGKTISIENNEYKVIGISDDAQLVVQAFNGEIKLIFSGEVTNVVVKD